MNSLQAYRLRLALAAAGFIPTPCKGGKPVFVPHNIPSEGAIRTWANLYDGADETCIRIGEEFVVVASVEAAKAFSRMAEQEETRSDNKPARRPAKRPTRDAGYKAQRFLVEFLSPGPRRASEVKQAARAQGISGITLRRAAKVACVVVEPVLRAGGGLVDHWTWRLGDIAWKPKAPEPVEARQASQDFDRPKDFGRPLSYQKVRY
jgi:hypothetical protein